MASSTRRRASGDRGVIEHLNGFLWLRYNDQLKFYVCFESVASEYYLLSNCSAFEVVQDFNFVSKSVFRFAYVEAS